MKIMPLIIIKIFAVMEIIGFVRHSLKASYGNGAIAEVIQSVSVWIASFLSVARNDKFAICDDKSKDELFSRNDYGKDFIFYLINFNQ